MATVWRGQYHPDNKTKGEEVAIWVAGQMMME
jgi:hypothetical protein